MSWFNASQLSSFAKQALSQAQKSIDRVLDIKEDETAWADSIIGPYNEGSGSSIKGSWEGSNWGGTSEDSQTQVLLSPTAITKPVRRTVVDESETFFNAFLSSPEGSTVTDSSVVSKAPTKSQRPKEEVKSTTPPMTLKAKKENEPGSILQNKNLRMSLTQDPELPDIEQSLPYESDQSAEEKADAESSRSNSEANPEDLKDQVVLECKPESVPSSPSPTSTPENKDLSLDTKDQKPEDRQSNTPSPPISTFSSGTSTTSDIEVLDHESVISESSVSSRQEVSDSKASLHLMQTSFQLLSPSVEYARLDEFHKLTESCSSSDAFERIDSFSVQSLDSRSVSEINSDDELPGRQCTLVSMAVSYSTPNEDSSSESKSTQSMYNTPLVHSSDDIEMEESGRSATPVNTEQPDLLLIAAQTLEAEAVDQGVCEVLCEKEPEPKPDYSTEDLQKMVEELTSRLEKRETQLLSVSKEKALLEEAHDNLKDEMVSIKEEYNGVSVLKEEFTHRIAEAEKKAQLACKERDLSKKEVKVVKEELAMRLHSSETAELMKEKDEQIKGLMEEGEKLSKQQLHNSNIIKKLRVKEKEHEQTITKQTKKIRELEEELQLLKQALDAKEEVEKQHRDNIRKLNAVVERQEKDLSRLQTDTEEFQEKNRSLQSALDSSYRELAELHKANATKASEAQEVALSCEIKAKEEICLALEKAKEESQKQQEALAIQVADLRLTLQRAEQQAARKEDYLRQEIAELQQRLQEGETRNQELSQSVTSATRPLLRQIENLQATLAAQTSSWEKLEKNLSDRLAESQTCLASAVEKERACTEELLAIKTQISAIESQNSLLRQEKGRFQAQLEVEKARLSKMEDEHGRNEVELENLKLEHKKTVEEARKEKNLLTSQLEMEKMKVEQEKKKTLLAMEAAKEKERKSYGFPTMETGVSTPSLSRSSSISGADFSGLQTSLISQDDPHEHTYGSMSTSFSGSNLYDAVRMGAGSSVIENLQSQLKLREGEIAQLQVEIVSLEKTRSILAEEVVNLNNLNDELNEKVKEIPKLRAQMRDLDQRYNTILQMYGEKAEEAEELKLDLEDVKNMYKTQIDELLKQRIN